MHWHPNVGRYPVIRRFAEAVRSLPCLWSFKREHVWPARYVGSVFAGLATAVLLDVAWQLLAWEARLFRARRATSAADHRRG